MRGAALSTAPTLLTLNPIGSMVADAGLHVSAVVHSYDGDTFLPPHPAAAPSIALHRCAIGGSPAECGALEVAENPSEPSGRHIPLKVAVLGRRATSGGPTRCSGLPAGAAPGSATTLRRSHRPSPA